ncbi:MAG: glycoside hydrolase family 2 protein, partial [Clostridia bacterium]|nr:glycoside hydrolase family 2 protein [Clostridia bacterium]
RKIDTYKTTFGFRSAHFRADGFYLNGRKLKIVGLNRHQSYPYVGYAMPASAQRHDADILKYELGVNAVRTSHYPQSQHFIDRCDETGLLVFTEIPGWQHIGGEEWRRVAVENVREMVTQYRNHPSVILWGVRINESRDDDELYKETNRTARELDPTRQTGGVRCFKKGSFLEDVYTYNDFSHDGTNAGGEKKKNVTSDKSRGYLVSEYNGHMFPTKSYDCERVRTEQAIRHAAVLDAVAGADDISGSFAWCMFDYNTHRDFGSGDRICYHGVLDMFRNPKTAACVYSAMQDDIHVLEVSSSMDIGEMPASNRGRVFVFTNADSVRMYKNGEFIKEYTHADSQYKRLRCPPIEIDDYIGDRIEKDHAFKRGQAKIIKELLNYSARFGSNCIPFKLKLKAARLIVRYGMKPDDMYPIYGMYIGNWGDAVTEFRFEAVKDGKVVKTVVKSPSTMVKLEAMPDRTRLVESDTYDVASVRIRAVDENENVLPFYMGSVKLEAEGAIEIVGPSEATLRGGLGGTYVRTVGKEGTATLRLTMDGAKTQTIEFTVVKE